MEFDTASAVERLDRMVIPIETEVRLAIRTERAVECANRVVTEEVPDGVVLPGGDSYCFVRTLDFRCQAFRTATAAEKRRQNAKPVGAIFLQ